MRRRNLRESFGGELAPKGIKRKAPLEARKANVEKPVKVQIKMVEVPAADPDALIDEIKEDLNLPPVPDPPPATKPRRSKRKKK